VKTGGSWFNGRWYDDVVVLAPDQRTFPETVPHEVIAEHPVLCDCAPCGRYPVALRRRLKRARLRS
jgi:hypothetical protein